MQAQHPASLFTNTYGRAPGTGRRPGERRTLGGARPPRRPTREATVAASRQRDATGRPRRPSEQRQHQTGAEKTGEKRQAGGPAASRRLKRRPQAPPCGRAPPGGAPLGTEVADPPRHRLQMGLGGTGATCALRAARFPHRSGLQDAAPPHEPRYPSVWLGGAQRLGGAARHPKRAPK